LRSIRRKPGEKAGDMREGCSEREVGGSEHVRER
jgi:hypothetical protein